jgi:hypothetical protein
MRGIYKRHSVFERIIVGREISILVSNEINITDGSGTADANTRY